MTVEGRVRPRIKICCMASLEEALLAAEHGADAVGLVSEMPSGPGPIPESLIIEIAAALKGRGVRRFLLSSKPDATAIIAQVRRTGVDTVQVVDRLALGTHRDLRVALPGVDVVQVVHVVGERSVREAQEMVGQVDAILLDSGRPDAAVKELGGTGRTHDWNLSRRIRDLGVPLWLAGGLTPDNVGEAIAAVRPFGVDVCSGVRTDGRLDPKKVAAFVAAAERAA